MDQWAASESPERDPLALAMTSMTLGVNSDNGSAERLLGRQGFERSSRPIGVNGVGCDGRLHQALAQEPKGGVDQLGRPGFRRSITSGTRHIPRITTISTTYQGQENGGCAITGAVREPSQFMPFLPA